jgi:hypothetical protein
MSEEKRKSVRIESDQFISFKVYDEQNRICNEGMALAKDISKTGVLLENREGFEISSNVDLAIALTEEILNVKGIVRNSNMIDEQTHQIGIEFVDISEEELTKLASDFPNIL